MNTLVCTSPGHMEYRTAVDPAPSKTRAIVRIRRVGVCGTDLHAFDGNQPFFDYPRIFGHELSGELVDVDETSGFKPGQRVTVIPYFACGYCIACRQNKPNCCVSLKVCGVHIDGALQEYFSVPLSSLITSETLSYDQLALVEPLAIGAHGIGRAQLQPGEFVVVAGAGPIGMAAMEFARIAGGQVIALDVNEDRLSFCREHLQVLHTINLTNSNAVDSLNDTTNGEMASVVVDATGNRQAIVNGFGWMAQGARYVLIGIQKEQISFSHPEFHKREGTLLSSRNATRLDFDHVMRCISNHAVNSRAFINNRISFAEAKESFENGSLRAKHVVKTVIEF